MYLLTNLTIQETQR